MALAVGRRASTVVGLDIQAGEVVAVEAAHGGREIKRAATAALPPGLMHEGEIADPEALVATLKNLFQRHRLPRRVRLGVASQRVIVRAIELPAIENRDDLEAAVRFQAGERLPMPLGDAVIDFQVVERFLDGDGRPRDRIVIVAAPKQVVTVMMTLARKAGLKLAGIDADAFALIRSLHGAAGNGNGAVAQPADGGAGEQPAVPDAAHGESETGDAGANGRPSAAEREDAVVYCHLGSVTSFAVAHGPNCMFARTLSYGMETIERQLAERRQLSVDDARRWLVYVGLAADVDKLEGERELVAACRSSLEEGVAQLGSVIQASLDYYAAQPEARAVRKVLVSGPGTEVAGLVEALDEPVPAPVMCAQPPVSAEGIPTPHLALAYGLAIDEVAE